MERRIGIAVAVAAIGLLSIWPSVGHAPWERERDTKGPSARCIVLAKDLRELTYVGAGQGDQRSREIVNLYDRDCR